MANIEKTDSYDELTNRIINNLHTALDHPVEKVTSGEENTLDHLIAEFMTEDTAEDEEFIDLIEEIIHESGPNSASSSSYKILPSSKPNESSFRSSIGSFLAKVFGSNIRRNDEHAILSPLPSIPSINSANNEPQCDESALQAANEQIEALEAQGPAGLVDISALGNAINRRIQVWTSSMTLCHDIGKVRPGPPLNLQYHSQLGQIQGHWTILGSENTDQIDSDLNDCLFTAIAAEVGQKPSELRAATVENMKKNINSLSRRIQNLARLKECEKIVLMVGGAKYNGETPRDARDIFDFSQHSWCYPEKICGHPRAHASSPPDSAEAYSKEKPVTGFLSYHDQDYVGHLALSTQKAQEAMVELNNTGMTQKLYIDASELPGSLPQGLSFINGVKVLPKKPIKGVFLILKHHLGHEKNPNFEVFVHTFYPVLK